MVKIKIVSIIISLIVFSGCNIINEQTQNYNYPQYGFAVTIPDDLKETTNDGVEDNRFKSLLAEFVHANSDTVDTDKPLATLTIAIDDEIPAFLTTDESLPTGVGVSEISEYVNDNALTIYEAMTSDAGWIVDAVWIKVDNHYVHFYFTSHSFNVSENLDTNQYKEEIINSLILLEE